MVNEQLQSILRQYYCYFLSLYITDVLVAFTECLWWWLPLLNSSVNEESGPLTVCAQILFINGTALITANHTVIISAYDRTAGFSSAQSK